MTLGIGDKKHFIVTYSTFGGINDNVEAVPVSITQFPDTNYFINFEIYGDNESYLNKLFDADNKETIRKVDYSGDYTVSYNREISVNQFCGV
jgi:hypothetical protein